MTGSGFAFDAEKRYGFRFRAQRFNKLFGIEFGEALGAICVSKRFAEMRALTLGDPFFLVRVILALAHFTCRRQFWKMQVADPEFRQAFLQAHAVGKGIFRPAHTPTRAYVTECVD